MRLRGAKGELEDLGEEVDDNVENLTKMQGQILNLTHGHVNIFEDNGDFKSTYDILKGIYEVWGDLTDMEQADLLETVAGKHRANTVASILSNFEKVEDAYQSALDSTGSASEENAKWMDSLQGHLNQLETAWESFANTFMSSDFLKGCVDVLTTILKLLDELVEHVGTLGTIGIGVAGFNLFKYFKNYSGAFKDIVSSSDDATKALKNGVADAAGNAARAVENAGSSASKSAGGFKAFATSLNGFLSIAGIVATAIGVVVSAIDNYYKEQSRVRQEAIEKNSTFLNSMNAFEQAYVKYSGKTNLTADEESELKSAIDGTVSALGDKSSALQKAVDSSSDYITSLDEIAKAELEAARNAAKDKKDNAERELESIVKGWTDIDGSEVKVGLGWDNGTVDDATKKAMDIAEKVGGSYYKALQDSGRNITGVTSNYMGFDIDANANAEEIVDYYNMLVEYKNELMSPDSGIEDTAHLAALQSVNNVLSQLSGTVEIYVDSMYDLAKAQYQATNGIPKTVDEYLKMREAILDSINGSMATKSNIASMMDSEYGQIFDLNTAEVQARKLVGIIDDFDEEQAAKFEVFLNMRSSVNNGECTVGEYIDSINDIESVISGYDEETQKVIKTTFALDTDNVQRNYKDLLEKMSKSVGEADAKKFLGGLTASQLSAAVELDADLKIDWNNISTKELQKMIDDEAAYIEAMNYTIDIKTETEGIENLNESLAEANSAVGLTEESVTRLELRYMSLKGYNQAKLFEETATGIRLNAEEFNKLEQEYADSKIAENDEQLKVLSDRYNQLGEEIQNCSDIEKRAELYKEQEDVREKINLLAEEAAAFEGLTNAYAKWQNAESVGNNRDMYANVQSAMESVKEELDLGWVDDGTKEYFDLIWGDNWNSAGKGIEDYRAKWATLDDTIDGTTYSIQDFFKVDEDGNLKASGINNFFDAVRQKQEELGKNWVEFDKDGNLTTIDLGVDGEQAIADALGISEELVDIFMQASKDAGFVVTIDGKYTKLADLQNRAEEAAQTLKDLGKTDFDFDFDTTSLKSVQEQLVEAENVLDKFRNKDHTIKAEFIKSDGTFTEDAQAAIDVMSTLTAMADKLAEPKYMQLETNQVEDSLQEPLKDIQKFEELCQTKHQYEITGKGTKELDEQMQDIVTSLNELPEETKIDLGIDGLTPEQIQEKLEAGEITIDATVDIQMEMSDDLKDIRALLMHQAGLISDEELTLMIDFDFDTSKLNELTDEEKSVLVDFVPDTTDIDNYTPKQLQTVVKFIKDVDDIDSYTPEQRTAIVDFVKDVDDIDSYTPEQKSVVAEFVADTEGIDDYSPQDKKAIVEFIKDADDIDSYTPEEKQAIAKYAVDGGDVDSYSPEDRKAIVKFLTNSADPDSYTPEQRKAIVKFLKESGEVDGYQPGQKEAIVRFGKDSSEPDNYKAPTKPGTVKYGVNTSAVDSYQPKTKFGKIIYNIVQRGAAAGKAALQNRFGISNGTAYVNGTAGRAFKQGDWGTKTSGKALVGELGQELLVRDGHYYTIGDNGAEFIDYKKGDIIFNAGQTRQLFEQGKIVNGQTRGRAYVDGNVLNNPSLVNLLGITPFTGVSNLNVSPINEDAISTLEEYNTLLEDAIELGYDFKAQTVFGNIDTNNRQLLTWTDENINMYHDALKSLGYSDEDIVSMKGDVSTVMGMWSNFGENGEYEIAFSPMLQTDDGPVLLSADTVYDYIEGLIAEASEDGVVTADELFELDARGEGNISNLLAAFGSSADAVSQLMHYVGKDGAIAMSINADGAEEAASDVNDLNNAVSETKNYTGEKFTVGVDDYGIQDAIEWMDELNGYIEESASSTGLVAESMEALTNRYKDLDGFDVASLFQESATGIQLNTDAVKKYEQQMAKDRSDKINKALKSLRREYYANAKAIKTCTDAGKKQQLIDRNAAIREEIKSIDALSAAYDGATSKYNQWAEASSKSKQREPYDNINNEFDNVLDLLDRGWLGDEEVTSFLDLVYGDNYDTAGKTADEVAADLRNKMSQVIDGTSYSIGDFFTYDDNGKMTADGYFNMLDAIMQKQQELGENWVQMDENGNYTFDFGVNGLDEIAEAFGISKDLLALILQAGRDAGHEVNFGGVIENIDALEQKATGAVDKLHEIGATDYQFNLNTGDVDSLTEQLDVANGVLDQFRNEDGTINMDMDGAQEAIALVQYLQAQIDLVNSHYINIETDDESLQEPLEKLQDYEILAAELNSLNIDPQVNADEITSVEQQMQEIVDYIAGLDGETLAKLGLNFDGLTTEEIQQQITDAIKNGTVTIPIKPKVESTDEAGGSNTSEVNTTVNVNTNDPDGSLKFLDEYAEKYGENGITLKAQLSGEGVDQEVIDDCKWLVDTYGEDGVNLALALTDGTNEENYGKIMGLINDYGDKGFDFAVAITNDEEGTNTGLLDAVLQLSEEHGGKAIDIGYALADKTEAEQAKWLDFIESHPNDFEVTYHAIVTGDTVLLKKIIGEDNSGNALELDADEQDTVKQDGTNTGTVAGTQRVHADNNGSYEYQQPEPDINGVDVVVGGIDTSGIDTSIAQAVSDQVDKIPPAVASVPGRLGEALSGAQETMGEAISNAGEELASVPERFGNALSEAWNNSVVGKWFNDTFGVKTANASEADEGSSAKDSSNNSGKSGGRSANGSKPVQHNDLTEAGSVVSVDTSNVTEVEVPVKGELEDTDTSNAPEEQVDVKGKMDEVDDSVLNDPFQIAVDDSGIKDALQDGETLKSTLLGLNNSDVLAIGNMMLPGLSEAVTDANQMRDIISGISSDGLVNIFTNTGIESALVDAETFNAYLDTLTSEQRQVVLDLVTPEGSEEQTVNAEIQADDSDVVAKTSEQRTVPANINLNTAVMDSYLGTTKHSTVALDPYLIKKSFTGTIALTATSVSGTGNVKVNGTSNANGTAYVNGTVGKAFKHGNWGTKESGTALVGELGQEMVVRDGHFFTVGDNGAEFFNYKKGDIVFNAGQTKQLFEQGKIINGQARGRAYANGTAFGVGTASGGGGRRPKTTTSGSRGNYTGSGGGSSSSSYSGGDSDASDEADEFEETLDWIETKIDRIERAISKLDTTASSVYKNWGTRNEALVNQISKVGEEINLQQQAYDRYMKQANSVGLSEDYASKVRDGTIDIETITDEDLNDKISDYKEW